MITFPKEFCIAPISDFISSMFCSCAVAFLNSATCRLSMMDSIRDRRSSIFSIFAVRSVPISSKSRIFLDSDFVFSVTIWLAISLIVSWEA